MQCICEPGSVPPVALYESPRPLVYLRVATDFSGIDMPLFALRIFSEHFTLCHVCSSESYLPARDFISSNHHCQRLFHDALHRPDRQEHIDLYISGPPCQPWSAYGKGQGRSDPRGRLFDASIRFISTSLPKVFILENSNRLMSTPFLPWLQDLLEYLRQVGPGYRVDCSLLNTQDHGLPQYRLRTYIVGCRADVQCAPFRFPDVLPSHKHLRLADILLPRLPDEHMHRRPMHTWTTAVENVNRSMHKAASMGLSPSDEWAIAHQRGLTYSGRDGQTPRFVLPCLLFSNHDGYWLGARGRHAHISEHSRAQGLPYHGLQWPSDSISFSLLGNSMSCNILERLLAIVLPSMWGFSFTDPWISEDSQARLRADVLAVHSRAGRQRLEDAFRRGARRLDTEPPVLQPLQVPHLSPPACIFPVQWVAAFRFMRIPRDHMSLFSCLSFAIRGRLTPRAILSAVCSHLSDHPSFAFTHSELGEIKVADVISQHFKLTIPQYCEQRVMHGRGTYLEVALFHFLFGVHLRLLQFDPGTSRLRLNMVFSDVSAFDRADTCSVVYCGSGFYDVALIDAGGR